MAEIKRNAKGQWAKGQTGNPKGRRTREYEDNYYHVTTGSVSFDDWKAIVIKAVEQAKNGDYQARKFLGEYLMGAPQQYLDIVNKTEDNEIDEYLDGLTLEELKQLEQAGKEDLSKESS